MPKRKHQDPVEKRARLQEKIARYQRQFAKLENSGVAEPVIIVDAVFDETQEIPDPHVKVDVSDTTKPQFEDADGSSESSLEESLNQLAVPGPSGENVQPEVLI